MSSASEAAPMSTEYQSVLSAIIERTVGPQSAEIDRSGTYPRDSIKALADAGLLGLISAPQVGGAGESLASAAHVVDQLAQRCGSTAMVVLMHYAAVAVIEAHGPQDVRRLIARGDHVTSLAFSEAGSRSHFWAPVGTATAGEDDTVVLDASKSWVTAAGYADSYVWSSKPLAAARDGMTLWLVPSKTDGLQVRGRFDGLGLRGNASNPVFAAGAVIPADARLGDDGAGLEIALATALPHFLVLNAAFSLGTMEALLAEAAAHLARSRLEHLGESLSQQPHIRASFGRLRMRADAARALLRDALDALGSGRDDTTLRVLEVKAVAGETAAEVADGVMRLCGGTAFRKELGVERRFRDSLAARVMAPTSDALEDFVGRVCLGQPLLDAPATPA